MRRSSPWLVRRRVDTARGSGVQHRDAARSRSSRCRSIPPCRCSSVSIAARLAFGAGERNVSHRLLMLGMGTLLIGDVLYFLTDTGVDRPPGRIVDLPYGLTYTLLAAAALHPEHA